MREHLDRLFQCDQHGSLIPVPVRFGRTGETRAALLVAEPGDGKTHTVNYGLSTHPAMAPRPDGSVPWLFPTVPSPASLKSMVYALLKASGYHLQTSRRSIWELVDVLRDRLHDHGYCVVWIDEGHDLFCKDRDLILRFLKSLTQGDKAVVVVMSGTALLDEVIRSDPQVQRRFSAIRPPALTTHVDGKAFEQHIADCCRQAGLAPPDEPDLLDRLFHAARYRFGRAIEMTIDAVEQALTAEADRLEVWHYALVWGMQEGPEEERNVFLAPDWQSIETDPVEVGQAYGRRRTSGRRGGR